MLSISPTSPAVAAARPLTGASWLAFPDWRYDEKPAPAARGGGLTADDIPCDSEPVPYEYRAPIKRFPHKPTVTLRRCDQIEVVTGPVEPVIPHTDETTKAGWERYYVASAGAKAAAIAAAKDRAAQVKKFFHDREDKAEQAYQERCRKAEAKGKPIPEPPVRKPPPPDWMHYLQDPMLVAMYKAPRDSKERAKRIRAYEHRGSTKFADREYLPFDEKFKHSDGTPAPAIRSWLGILALQLFNSALPKGNIQYGRDKERENSSVTDGVARIYAVDSSYVVLDKGRRCAFVVDLDGWWPDLAALRAALRLLLPPEFMPNLITYRGAEDGKGGVENPHLVWMLPPGARVLRGRSLAKQLKLHAMIQAGIVSHLIPAGADPGHTNSFKTKCPLSPGWSVEACDDHFRTMRQWREFLPTITPNLQEMKRRAKTIRAAKEADVDVTLSQAIWHDGIAARRIEIASAQRRQDPLFLTAVRKRKDNRAFVDWLYHATDGVVVKRLLQHHPDTRALRSVIAAQRAFILELGLTPSEIGQSCDRGRDAAANIEEFGKLPSNATKEERKARADLIKRRARQRTQANKAAINCGLIAEEIEARMAAGIPVVKAEVVRALVKAGTVGRSTAYNRFDNVFDVVQRTARYQVKPSASISPQSPASAHTITVETFGSLRNPGKTYVFTLPGWVVDKRTLTEFEEACRIRSEWREAVAEWREARQRWRRSATPDDGFDLAADPAFRAMVLERSSWANHRRH